MLLHAAEATVLGAATSLFGLELVGSGEDDVRTAELDRLGPKASIRDVTKPTKTGSQKEKDEAVPGAKEGPADRESVKSDLRSMKSEYDYGAKKKFVEVQGRHLGDSLFGRWVNDRSDAGANCVLNMARATEQKVVELQKTGFRKVTKDRAMTQQNPEGKMAQAVAG